MVYGMAWQARHGTCYGLAGMAWFVLWLGGNNMVYSMAWQACHGIWYGLAGMSLFMEWPCGHGMIFGMAWEGMAWYMVLPG